MAGVTTVSRRVSLVQVGRDAVALRYRRTILGWPWLVIRPLVGGLGATFLFSRVLDVEAGGGVPYLLFVLVGQGAWALLDRGVQLTTRSLDGTRSLRRAIPLSHRSAVVAFLFPVVLEAAFVAVLVAGVAAWYRIADGASHVVLGPKLVLVLAGALLMLLIALGIGLITSVLGEGNRDTRWTLRFVVSPWVMVTPVMYPVGLVPDGLRWSLSVNPATLPVLLVREGVFGDAGITPSIIAGGLAGIFVIATAGAVFSYVRRPADTGALDG